jgi:asparagine synthase (glutamine-hydrolysing)
VSAICGIYHKTAAADNREAQAVMAGFGKYHFDKTGSYLEGPVFLGCCVNHVTPESLYETLPYEDKKASHVITADAIIDNREELLALLSIPEKSRNCPDSFLILEAYKKWGVACPEKLAGDFAFAIWDKNTNELFCARDHTGGRTLYYYDSKDAFMFATVMEPLFKTGRLKKRLNETYIANYLAAPIYCHEINGDITIYKEIFPLPPACAMSINKDGIRKWRYWEIKKTQEIHFNSDEEYEAAFREIYSEAVRCRLRSVRKVGILLSGGLDSGSVACLAAQALKSSRGEKLISFTQVPITGYRDWLPANQVADEREYAEEICAFTGNIEPHYFAFEGRNPLNVIDERIKAYEQPFNLVGNSYWVDEIQKEAARMGVGILLCGKIGNATVSWGKFHPYMKYLLKSLDFKTFLKESEFYAERKQIKQTKLILSVLLKSMPYGVQFLAHKIRKREDFTDSLCAINPEFYTVMGVKNRFEESGFNNFAIDTGDPLRQRLNMLNSHIFSHIGATATIQSLVTGIVKRDPTRDKRLIEFCINLPEDQWVRNGEERRFIRHAMKGYMPDKVRLNYSGRGRQDADWMQRITPEEWTEAYKEMETIGEGELERKYLDIPKLKRFLAKNKALSPDDHDGNESGVKLLIQTLTFTKFLRNQELKY